MRSKPWYNKYEELVVSTKEKRSEYFARCKVLGAAPEQLLGEVWHELVTRAVKESNWQEGLKLDGPRTQIMATEALYIQQIQKTVRIDTNRILNTHRRRVAEMLRRNSSREEIGAFNLSAAYYALPLIGRELHDRQTIRLIKLVQETICQMSPVMGELPKKTREILLEGNNIVESLKTAVGPALHPMTKLLESEGEYVQELLKEDFEYVLHPMPTRYIHFLHRLTLAGLYPNTVCGRYRKHPVHVGLECFPSA